MIRGIQSSVQAMRSHLARQQVVAQNLSNLLTPGYKQETPLIASASAMVSRLGDQSLTPSFLAGGWPFRGMGSLGIDLGVGSVAVDFRQGALQQTDRPLDIALAGDGFLRVRTPEGVSFSRGGALQADATGRLVTSEGYPVLGADGDIVLREGAISVARDGRIDVDGEPAARLEVVEFQPGTRMAKVGSGLFAPEKGSGAEPAAAVDTEVKGGFLEGSNVDEVSAMTDLVQSLRAYQASQRVLQAQDELLGKAVNEVGRV